MDKQIKYNYVWDEEKRRINIKKHNLDFIRAEEVFSDPRGLLLFDESKPEERFIFIGLLDGIIVTVVVFTEKDYTYIRRIISFRKANKRERKEYYGRR